MSYLKSHEEDAESGRKFPSSAQSDRFVLSTTIDFHGLESDADSYSSSSSSE